MSAAPYQSSFEQRQASDPAVSAWVAANAGSGKTTVLVQRVIRLLLDGNEPERILCLTYTKAAAALMANRLFGELASWVTLADKELAAQLAAIGIERPDRKRLDLARRLFTRSLETPGGLKIQTIHAFCERLLQLFPVEAGIVPGFSVMDEMTAQALLMEARNSVIAGATGETARALLLIAARAQAQTLDQLIHKLLAKRSDLAAFSDGGDLSAVACATLRAANGLDAAEDRYSLEQSFIAFDERLYARIAAALENGSTRERDAALRLRACLGPPEKSKRDRVHGAFFAPSTHRPFADSWVMTKATQAAEPELWIAYCAERGRLDALDERMAAMEMIEASRALLCLGSEIMQTYAALKRGRGIYDFDDLIGATRALLTRGGAAQWVLYKLDGGIHHLLIDEAQDTSPAQWEIVRALTDDFFSGQGAVEYVNRTVFAVGDRKQSIFSFQGADPDGFDTARTHYTNATGHLESKLRPVALKVTHRSVPVVLKAVEETFAEAARARGLLGVEEDRFPQHDPTRLGEAGHVEIWPLEEPDEDDVPEPFEAPVDRPPVNHPRRKLARRIAGTIAGWLDDGRHITARGRPVTPGDVLILVRSRSMLVEALQSELQARKIPVAGADRLKLAKHIAVQDLLALGRFCANRDDDYSLACLLKSPLVRRDDGEPFDDDDLFALAHGRGDASLWHRLTHDETHAAIASRLRDDIDLAGELTPFAFFARVLTRSRKRFLARLGADAAEPLDAFLDRALDFELDNTPTLTGFLAWFEEAGGEIKRDMEQEAAEVRIMTVHGAKGLEANIVFLADAADVVSERGPQLLFGEVDGIDQPVPFWKLGGMRTPETIERWITRRDARRADEERRLLYVAMTRARDELYICGCGKPTALKPESWYAMALGALGPSCETDGEGKLRLAQPQTAAVPPPLGAAISVVAAPAVPVWAMRSAPLERAAVTEAWEPLHDAEAAERGRVIHRLFDTLPRLEAEARLPTARKYLERVDADPGLADRVIAILEDARFAPFFTGEMLSEVPYSAVNGSGRIDRLFLTESAAMILDFKSDRAPPASPEAIPPLYLRQIARYCDAVKRMGGDRQIGAAILWTETAQLMEIPPAMLADLA